MIRSRTSVRIAVTVVLAAIVTVIPRAQGQPPRIAPTDPRLKIVHAVEAVPVAGAYANSVKADVVIAVDGSVESVKVLQGHKAHHASALAALKQYRFAPVIVDGKPTRVIVRMSAYVPDTVSTDTLAKTFGTTLSTSVPARSDVVLLADCSRALSTQDGSPRAIQTCLDAVAAADAAGAAAFSRTSPRKFLGDVYMYAGRWAEAVAAYRSALAITAPPDADDLSTAETLGMIALAQLNLGELEAADGTAESATVKIEALMTAHPEQRQKHVPGLRAILLLHARIKGLRGDAPAATELQRKAAALDSPK